MKKIVLAISMMTLSLGALTAAPLLEKDSKSVEIFQECTIKIKGTYDGKVIDVEVTVEADDCATAAGKVLKGAIN